MTVTDRIARCHCGAIASGMKSADLCVFLGPSEVKELENHMRWLLDKSQVKHITFEDGKAMYRGMVIVFLKNDGVRVGSTFTEQ
jgi:hypothetical protein